jgi:phage tail sheath protein FI
MVEILHPGVYVIEKFDVPPTFEGVGVSTAGFIGVAKKGPLQSAGFVGSYTEFIRKYGDVYRNNYLAHAVRGFFDCGGKRAYIARIAADDAELAEATAKDMVAADTLKLYAANPGAWGNGLSFNTLKFAAALDANLATGATEATLTSVRGIAVGDVVKITDGTTTTAVIVLTVNTTDKKITFKAITLAATILAATSVVATVTTHKTSTKTASALATGGTQVTLDDTRNIVEGTVLTIAAALANATVIVSRVSGNTVFFDAVTLSSTIAAGAVAVSQEFTLQVFDSGVLVETHEFLSMQEKNNTDHVDVRLAGRANASVYVIAEDQDAVSAEELRLPFLTAPQFLVDGDDGSTPDDDDYIGSQAPNAKSGMYLFDTVDEVNFISCPGVTTVSVQVALANYAEVRTVKCMAILSCPVYVDTVEEAEEYRKRTLNIDSSYAALYWPWIVVNDPQSTGMLTLPPDGFVSGIYADVAVNRGVHKAPANERVRTALGLTTDGKDIDYDAAQDILNPIGVNVIRPFPGRGIRVFGERTLWSVKDQRHYVHVRRTLNYIEETIRRNAVFAVFEPNDEDLWRRVTVAVSAFLYETWRSGALAPRGDKSRAYFVKCDAETNPQSGVDLGKCQTKVGVNITGTAEFVIFEVTRFDGGRLVEELS